MAAHQSDRYYKTMTTYKQFIFLFYGVIMRCKSLNNLCKNLLLLEGKLIYLGINYGTSGCEYVNPENSFGVE